MSGLAERFLTPRDQRGAETKVPLAFAVSKGTVDITVIKVPRDLPRSIYKQPIGEIVPVSAIEFNGLKDELKDRKVKVRKHDGGNGNNIVNYMEASRKPEAGPPILRTWVGKDKEGELIRKALHKAGVKSQIVDIPDGETPKGLIIPRRRPDGVMDRTIFSYNPEKMPSEFVSGLIETPQIAFVNSLAGPEWAKSLTEGVQHLQDRKINYIYTPGSAQFKAIKNEGPQKDAVYTAIAGASVLSVDKGELTKLIQGIGLKPAGNITALLEQGKSLGSERLLITDGAQGAYGIDRDHKVWGVRALPVHVKNPVGAGDAFIATATARLLETDNLPESLLWGNVGGSFAVEQEGAHQNPPRRGDIESRLKIKGQRALELEKLVYSR